MGGFTRAIAEGWPDLMEDSTSEKKKVETMLKEIVEKSMLRRVWMLSLLWTA
jgi:hypothetical protein